MSRMLKRHDKSDIAIHWFNAVCWFLLLVSGIGLMFNPNLNPLGDDFPRIIRTMAGGGGPLLTFHIALGLIWVAGFLLYLVCNLKGAIFFVKEIFSVSLLRDMTWIFRKMVLMTAGAGVLKKMGQPAELPDQGYYNMGQKAFAQVSVIGGIVIVVTGIIMSLSGQFLGEGAIALVSWSITLHYLGVGLVFAGLLVHIYMAAISPEERPGFRSMFIGTVPEEYAKHHHKLWFDTVNKE